MAGIVRAIRRCNRGTRAPVSALLALLLVLSGALRDATPVQAATVKITVRMARVIELNCDEGVGESCPNDYYPKFAIDGQPLFDGKDKFCCAHDTDFVTNWVFDADVDTSHTNVPIHMELFDQDDLSADDQIDIANGSAKSLDLNFNQDTCIFTGSGLTNYQGANIPNVMGTSEGSGSDSARIIFYITTPHCIDVMNTDTGNSDGDGDGIPQGWETPNIGINPPVFGLDINHDGIIDLNLGEMSIPEADRASPWQKDLFVEVDYMLGAMPQSGTLGDVITAFANAPVDPFPDPADPSKTKFHGIKLHAKLDDGVPSISGLLFQTDGPGTQDDFNDLKNGNPVVMLPGKCSGFFGTGSDRSSSNCVNILNAKRQVFRYMIFGETYAENTGSSGISEWDENSPPGKRGGNDFMVTVNTWSGYSNVGGKQSAEAATFMHELGHTLGLGHGGSDITNCKPDYLSVMNYTLQFPNYDNARPMDYSSASKGTALGTTAATDLDETGLDESKGLYGTPANPSRNTVFGVGGKSRVLPATSGAINWDGDSNPSETNAPADINFIASIDPANKYGCSMASPGQTLGGFDDWANIQYNPRLNVQFFADGARPNLPPELTEQTVRAMTQKADLKITKTADQTTAIGGDTVTYTVAVTDLGPGTATNIKVTDTLPDATTQDRSLPDLNNGGVNTLTPKFQYLVPCAAPDGAVLTNSVTVTGTDTDGVPDPYKMDNTASATTTVQAPKLTVSKTATASVNAGEAITYTLSFGNTGTGAASNVTITDTLPAGVYYSQALDLGAGPKPTSVTLNNDGTRTLIWNVGNVAAQAGAQAITFTARPTLLALAGTTYTNTASLAFKNASGACTFTPVTATASTSITVVPPTRDPLSQGYWKSHTGDWTSEILARVQATDQRYDTDQNGTLSVAEGTSAFNDDNSPKSVLPKQLLGTYFNLATRRINAATAINSTTAKSLNLATVRDAALYAANIMLQPVTPATSPNYSSIITVLDEINANKSEVY